MVNRKVTWYRGLASRLTRTLALAISAMGCLFGLAWEYLYATSHFSPEPAGFAFKASAFFVYVPIFLASVPALVLLALPPSTVTRSKLGTWAGSIALILVLAMTLTILSRGLRDVPRIDGRTVGVVFAVAPVSVALLTRVFTGCGWREKQQRSECKWNGARLSWQLFAVGSGAAITVATFIWVLA